MTRTPEDIANLFAYGRWATGKTLESAAVLDPEEFVKPIGGSFGSVQGTLAHLYGADWVWLERFQGRSPSSLPGAESLASLTTIRERWDPVHRGLRELVESLAPGRLAEPLTYVNFAGQTWTYPVGEALVHVANHGTYHRGQVATLLRQLGKKAASTDYLRWIDARGSGL
jgi:uncharacterized damage-inducible protein DinB